MARQNYRAAPPSRRRPAPPSRRRKVKHRPKAGQRPKTKSPSGHWTLVALLSLVIAVALGVEGYSHGVLGETTENGIQN